MSEYISKLENHKSCFSRFPFFNYHVNSLHSFSGDLAYEVLWFFTRLRGGQTTAQLASVDRFGIVKTEMRNSSSEISVERIDAHTYLLNIFGTQDG